MTSNQPSDPSTRPNEPTAPLPSRERVSSWGLCALKAIFLCCLTTLLSVSMVSTRRSAGSKPLHSNVHPAKHSHSRKVVPDLRRSRHPDSKAPSEGRKKGRVKNDDDISMASGEEDGDDMAVDDEAGINMFSFRKYPSFSEIRIILPG